MRAIWTGSLSFGLINIPVRMYSGEESRSGLEFDLLDKNTHSRIRYARVSRKSGEEIPYEDIVKGYEYRDGDYVILTDSDFQRANRQRRKTIDIKAFVDAMEIDDRYYKKPYYLEPQEGAESAYALLRESLKRAHKVAVAKYVLRNRDHLASIAPVGRAITLYELRFQDELRRPSNLNLPSSEATSEEQVAMALALIDQLTKHFNAREYHDTYSEELKSIIEEKAKGRPVKVGAKEKPATHTEDIMDMLRASLQSANTKSDKEMAHSQK